MMRADLFTSVFWIVLGAFISKWGYDLGLGVLSEPGSGFIIFWMGVMMIGLSMSILILTLLKRTLREERKSIWSGIRWKKIIFVLLSLIIYAYVLVPLGFLLSTFILLVYLFKGIERQKWYVAVLSALLTVLITYALFDLWLGSQLPRGVLELITR